MRVWFVMIATMTSDAVYDEGDVRRDQRGSAWRPPRDEWRRVVARRPCSRVRPIGNVCTAANVCCLTHGRRRRGMAGACGARGEERDTFEHKRNRGGASGCRPAHTRLARSPPAVRPPDRARERAWFEWRESAQVQSDRATERMVVHARWVEGIAARHGGGTQGSAARVAAPSRPASGPRRRA